MDYYGGGVLAFPTERFKAALTEQVAQSFDSVGYAVVDNAFGSAYCGKLRKEIQHLYDRGMLYSNKTYYDGKKENDIFSYSQAVSKPNIYELDLLQPSTLSYVPQLNSLYNDKTILEILSKLVPRLGLDHMDVKVQYNKGSGGAFPMHFDTTLTVSRRQMTCVLYLNPTWTSSSGGELRVFPFPYKYVDVPPVDDRLVIFSSHLTLHGVMPSWVPRYCVTLWLEGDPYIASVPSTLTNTSETTTSTTATTTTTTSHTTGTASTVTSTTTTASPPNPSSTPYFPARFPWLHKMNELRWILESTNRKSVSKVLFSEEWEESINNSFDERSAEAIVTTHRADVEAIKKKVGEDMMQLLQACLPLDHDEQFMQYGWINKGK